MTYESEHRRMRPVLGLARQLDIATNPAPEAIFEPGIAGFQIWCIPADHPKGWENIAMTTGAFSKPCEYVASVGWGWEDEIITHLILTTDAYALGQNLHSHNRPDDLAWAKRKIGWLFKRANVKMLPIQQLT